jgi:transposase-like protein
MMKLRDEGVAGDVLRQQIKQLADLLTAIFKTSTDTQVGHMTVHVLRESVDELMNCLQHWAAEDLQVQYIAADILAGIQSRYSQQYPEAVGVAMRHLYGKRLDFEDDDEELEDEDDDIMDLMAGAGAAAGVAP